MIWKPNRRQKRNRIGALHVMKRQRRERLDDDRVRVLFAPVQPGHDGDHEDNAPKSEGKKFQLCFFAAAHGLSSLASIPAREHEAKTLGSLYANR